MEMVTNPAAILDRAVLDSLRTLHAMRLSPEALVRSIVDRVEPASGE
jgi:hypothetical protein